MLIQIRIGPGKGKLVDSIQKVKSRCNIPFGKVHRIPHISLYGNFIANREQIERVKDAIETIGKKYSQLAYLIDGFRYIGSKKGKVIYFNIVPSEDFKKFRQELAEKLLKIVPMTKDYDKNKDFLFHSTLAYKLSDSEFERIWSCINNKKSLLQRLKSFIATSKEYPMGYFYLPMNALRVTFLNNQSKIICEYDFLQKHLLSRMSALNKVEWQKTLKLFRI